MDDRQHEYSGSTGDGGRGIREAAPPESGQRGAASHHFTDDFERTFLNGTAGNYYAEHTAADFRRWHADHIAGADAALGVVHRDDVPWYDAPIPPRFHRCSAQTQSLIMGVQRCACGAIAQTFGPWMRRNDRRGPWWKFGRR
jgi:hypothetical protein